MRKGEGESDLVRSDVGVASAGNGWPEGRRADPQSRAGDTKRVHRGCQSSTADYGGISLLTEMKLSEVLGRPVKLAWQNPAALTEEHTCIISAKT